MKNNSRLFSRWQNGVVPTALLLTLLALFSLGQLTRLQLTQTIAVYAHELVMVIWLLVIGRHQLRTSKLDIQWKHFKLELFLGAWILLGWLLAALQDSNVLHAGLYAGRFILYAGFLGSVRHWLSHTPPLIFHSFSPKPIVIRFLFMLAGLGVLWFGLLQYFLLPDMRWLYLFGWDDHYYRLLSTQLDPNFTGLILVITWLFLESVKHHLLPLLSSTHQRISGFLRVTLTIFLWIGILLTYSRASFLSLGVAIGGLLWLRRRHSIKWFYALLSIWFIVAIPLLPQKGGEGVNLTRTSSVTARISSTQGIVDSLQPWEWIVGRGLFVPVAPPSPNLPYHATQADNLGVLLLAGIGIGGLGLVSVLAIKWGRKLWQKSPEVLLILLTVLVHSFFNNSVFQPFVMMLWLAALASV